MKQNSCLVSASEVWLLNAWQCGSQLVMWKPIGNFCQIILCVEHQFMLAFRFSGRSSPIDSQ